MAQWHIGAWHFNHDFRPIFHRDDETLPEAHRFAPELGSKTARTFQWRPRLLSGKQRRPVNRLCLLAEMLREHDFKIASSTKNVSDPLNLDNLPGTLSPFSSRFAVTRR